jgi:hypothetical protein
MTMKKIDFLKYANCSALVLGVGSFLYCLGGFLGPADQFSRGRYLSFAACDVLFFFIYFAWWLRIVARWIATMLLYMGFLGEYAVTAPDLGLATIARPSGSKSPLSALRRRNFGTVNSLRSQKFGQASRSFGAALLCNVP